MRILHLDSGNEMRGGQWQVLRLMTGLRREGVLSTLLAPAASPLLQKALKEQLPAEPLGLLRVSTLARRNDLVHAHDARSHTLALLASRSPLVVSRRVAFPIRSRWKYRSAGRYLAVSRFVKSVLQAGGVPEEKIAVVYDGVPLLAPAQGTAVLALADNGDSQKGAHLVADAAHLARIPLHWTTDLENDLKQAAIFVYLTYSEGLGSAVLLAMSAGVPVVASRIGGLPEIIFDGGNGLLVDNSAAAVAEGIGKLRDSPALAARLGEAARLTVQERFTTEQMVYRTMEVYREVLS
jgi:glycosyltransferase involved in cell wall biosynthesis